MTLNASVHYLFMYAQVKGQGNSIQYHGQIAKERGEELYEYFCDCVRGLILEAQCRCRQDQSLSDLYVRWKSNHEQVQQPASDPSIPPAQLFRTSKYSSWEDGDTGIPLTDASGGALTKSALKKLRKLREAQAKRHEKWKKNRPSDEASSSAPETGKASDKEDQGKELWQSALDPAFCHIVSGSFGKRQGLAMQSDMGPFCHVFQV
jgi:hypothetical protein